MAVFFFKTLSDVFQTNFALFQEHGYLEVQLFYNSGSVNVKAYFDSTEVSVKCSRQKKFRKIHLFKIKSIFATCIQCY